MGLLPMALWWSGKCGAQTLSLQIVSLSRALGKRILDSTRLPEVLDPIHTRISKF